MSFPSRALASAMSTVQSIPTTSTPVFLIRSRRPPLPLAYRVSGTVGCTALTCCTMRLMYGPLQRSHSRGGSCPPHESKICKLQRRHMYIIPEQQEYHRDIAINCSSPTSLILASHKIRQLWETFDENTRRARSTHLHTLCPRLDLVLDIRRHLVRQVRQ